MPTLKIVFVGVIRERLDVFGYDNIKTVLEAIQKKDKWVELDECIINLDNIAFICTEEEE